MKIITSINNELIKNLILLKDKKYRQKKQQFLIEGFHLINEAKKTNNLLMILATEEVALKINDFDNIIIVSPQIIKKLSFTITPQPIIGVCKFLQFNEPINSENIILLDKIQDPSNLGNIMRSCLAFNIKTLYLNNDSVDLYNDKVIRSSMGAIFYLNIIYTNLEIVILELKTKKYRIYGTLFKKATNSLWDIKFAPLTAIVFGNEAHGISSNLNELIDENFYIPTNSNLESLNLNNALAVSLYEMIKQKK